MDDTADDERVAGLTGVVGVVVVLAVGQGFKVVTTVEELLDVGTTGALNDELATRVVGCVVSGVKNQVIKDNKVALTTTSNSIEFLFGHDGHGAHKLNVLALVDLVSNFHDDEGHYEGHRGHNPQVVPLHTAGVVRVDTRGSAVDSNKDEEPGEVLVDVTEAHQEGGVRASLPSAEVRYKASDDQG